MATKAKTGVQNRILKAALAIAGEEGWASAGLSAVAARAKVPVSELSRHFRDTDAIADAWFQVGLDAMLAPPPRGFSRRPAAARLEILMRRWFDALAPHRHKLFGLTINADRLSAIRSERKAGSRYASPRQCEAAQEAPVVKVWPRPRL